MQNENGNVLLFAGDKYALKPSLLFQFATNWADNGVRVSYLSATPLSELPLPVHGADFPTSSSLSQIQFLYLPRWQDLLQHLFSLHCHAHVPKALILQGLDHYCCSMSETSSMRDASDRAPMAQICAALIDALKMCSTRNRNEETYCICSYEIDVQTDSHSIMSFLNPFNIFFDNIWLVESIPRSCCTENSSLKCISGNCSVIKIKKLMQNGVMENSCCLEFLGSGNMMFLQRCLKILRS